MSSGKNKDKTVGVIVVTHTDFGSRLLKAAEMIVGPQDHCEAISVDTSHEMDNILESLRSAVERVDSGAGTLILTDMFGGTPTNLSLSLIGKGQFEVITGVNLPILIKVLGTRTVPLSRMAMEAKEAGVQGIVVAGEILRSKVKKTG